MCVSQALASFSRASAAGVGAQSAGSSVQQRCLRLVRDLRVSGLSRRGYLMESVFWRGRSFDLANSLEIVHSNRMCLKRVPFVPSRRFFHTWIRTCVCVGSRRGVARSTALGSGARCSRTEVCCPLQQTLLEQCLFLNTARPPSARDRSRGTTRTSPQTARAGSLPRSSSTRISRPKRRAGAFFLKKVSRICQVQSNSRLKKRRIVKTTRPFTKYETRA